LNGSYAAAALAAYLIGGIPFGYLIYYALTREDVRKVGSGNIGATNVGRLLGFRFFLLVFLLDLFKGLVPTVGLPRLFEAMGWAAPGDLPVAAALGAILGHNFPVYLGFRGGKGVATSLGALLALAPSACGVAAAAFFTVFLITRYVSLSSMTGGLAFAAAYFAWTAAPWSREHRALSVLVVAVVVLLIVRHRKNIGRLLAGTENRVNFGRDRSKGGPPEPPSGRVRVVVVAGLAIVAIALGVAGWLVARRASRPVEAVAGPWLLREVDRQATGQQRATRAAFDADGSHLTVLCPRYNRVLVYGVGRDDTLDLRTTIAVEGRPVAIAASVDRVAVLQRPVNDAKHLGEGWLDVYDLDGTRIGDRIEAGYYPDDLALTPNGRHLLILASGRGEGDASKHAPALTIFKVSDGLGSEAAPVGRVEFADGDDPDRLTLSHGGSRALVSLAHVSEAVAVDLADPAGPSVAARIDLGGTSEPYVSGSEDGDWMVIRASGDHEAVGIASRADSEPGAPGDEASYLIVARPEDSTLHVVQVEPTALVGKFPVMGPMNLGGAEPSALAFCEGRRLLAATTKPGTVHLIRFESRLDGPEPPVASR